MDPRAFAHLLSGYRAEQLVARARVLARRRIPLSLAPDRPPPPIDRRVLARIADGAWRRFTDAEHAERLVAGRARLLGREVPLACDADWAAGGVGRSALLDFTLHYHELLVPAIVAGGRAREAAHRALASWLRSCLPAGPALALSWHPYVISSRIVPWAAVLADGPPPALASALTRSLWRQLRVVAGHLERDVGGNHLIRNAKALAVGGGLFEGAAAAALRRRGQRLLAALLADQIGPDGGHVERSPAYHALVIEDALDAIEAARPGDDLEAIRAGAGAALAWLHRISPPGRPRPHLNDSSDDEAQSTAELEGRAAALGVEIAPAREPRGFPRYRVFGDAATRLLLDAGPPSRDDLPYHAHADSLAVLVQVDGVPIVVDRGVADYAGGARAWWRSTAAHSTVEIDGKDSSELVGAFRAGRLARTTVTVDEPHQMVAGHDGAGRGRLRHVRRVEQLDDRAWRVVDLTPAAASFVSRLHFAPGVELSLDGSTVVAAAGAARLTVRAEGAGSLEVRMTDHAHRLGESEPAPTLLVRSRGPRLQATLTAA